MILPITSFCSFLFSLNSFLLSFRPERLAFITAKYVDRVFYTEPLAEEEEEEEHSEGQQEIQGLEESSKAEPKTEEETNKENSVKENVESPTQEDVG